MFEYVSIGCSPCDEDCAQVGSDNYQARAKRECRAFVNQLWRIVFKEKGISKENAPAGFDIIVKGNSHDFGTYYEVNAKYNLESEESEEAEELAFFLEVP